MSGEFGAGCAAVPKTGDGSFEGMSTAPVATAASANPVLKTLVTAVTAADLVDTLNSAPELTVFAPANDAFGAIPKKDLNALLADKPALTKVLTHHVVEGKIAPEDLAGTHKTLAGDEVDGEGLRRGVHRRRRRRQRDLRERPDGERHGLRDRRRPHADRCDLTTRSAKVST